MQVCELVCEEKLLFKACRYVSSSAKRGCCFIACWDTSWVSSYCFKACTNRSSFGVVVHVSAADVASCHRITLYRTDNYAKCLGISPVTPILILPAPFTGKSQKHRKSSHFKAKYSWESVARTTRRVDISAQACRPCLPAWVLAATPACRRTLWR
jgi:hypothetical protein